MCARMSRPTRCGHASAATEPPILSVMTGVSGVARPAGSRSPPPAAIVAGPSGARRRMSNTSCKLSGSRARYPVTSAVPPPVGDRTKSTLWRPPSHDPARPKLSVISTLPSWRGGAQSCTAGSTSPVTGSRQPASAPKPKEQNPGSSGTSRATTYGAPGSAATLGGAITPDRRAVLDRFARPTAIIRRSSRRGEFGSPGAAALARTRPEVAPGDLADQRKMRGESYGFQVELLDDVTPRLAPHRCGRGRVFERGADPLGQRVGVEKVDEIAIAGAVDDLLDGRRSRSDDQTLRGHRF